MKRRTLPLAFLLAAIAIAFAFVTARLDAQTTFGLVSGGPAGEGSGTVTSVSLTAPAEITVAGSPVTDSGTFALTWASALQNRIFAGPSGANGTPTFRVLVAADIPSLAPSKITGTAVIDSDARLTNARTPTAHASTHASAGADAVTLAESQVTGLTAALAGKQATGNYITATTGDVVATGPGSVSATIQANSVALGTDTTGGYAASSTEAGPATTADALAANGTNCSAPNFARGVDASGNCEGAAIAATDLPSTTVTPGSYTATNLTVDAQGRITAASSGSGGDTLPIVDSTAVVKGSSDATKLLRFEVDGFTTGQTRVATPPDANFTMARTDAGQTFIGSNILGSNTVATTIPVINGSSGGFGQVLFLGTTGGLAPTFAMSGNFVRILGRSTSGYCWSSDESDATVGNGDTCVSRDAAGVVQLSGGTAGTTKGGSRIIADANGSSALTSSGTELLTLSTAGATTATSASLAAARSNMKAILVRVTTTITTATDWSVALTGGIASCTAAWVATGTATAAQTALTAGSTVVFRPASGLQCHTSTASTITVTTTGTPGAGALRITAVYEQFTAPTS